MGQVLFIGGGNESARGGVVGAEVEFTDLRIVHNLSLRAPIVQIWAGGALVTRDVAVRTSGYNAVELEYLGDGNFFSTFSGPYIATIVGIPSAAPAESP